VESSSPLCTVIGTRLRAGATEAALANGVAGHAHDFDDTNFTLLGHPSVPLLAAALAAAEVEPGHGSAVALAYITGFEVATAIGAAVNPAHYERGWHATSSIGTLPAGRRRGRLAPTSRRGRRSASRVAGPG
jgi:2-methylcitrate dehydratase PrpD